MLRFLGGLWVSDTTDNVRNTSRRAGYTLSSAVTPIVQAVSNTSQAIQNWIAPLPTASATHQIMWRRQSTYHPFTTNEPIELFSRFEQTDERVKITQNHVFCALHHPGLALDLCVLFNIELDDEHLNYVLNHYVNSDWSGANRDRLFLNLCTAMEIRVAHPERDQTYEIFIRNMLYDRSSLLYRVLDDHRYTYSLRAFMGKPETLTKLNDMLRESQAKRLRHQ